MDRAQLDQAIEWLRSDDSSIYEDGYYSISGHVDSVLDNLLSLASVESDGLMRGKFLELIGESINPKAIEFLISELNSSDIKIREWAYLSLANSESKQANIVAKNHAQKNPTEEFL